MEFKFLFYFDFKHCFFPKMFVFDFMQIKFPCYYFLSVWDNYQSFYVNFSTFQIRFVARRRKSKYV
jgi:hypothetical protein